MAARLPIRIMQMHPADLAPGTVAMIGGTWSHIYDVYTSADLDQVREDYADDPATLTKITSIITARPLDDSDGVYVAVRYLYTSISTGLPGTDYRCAVSPPRWAIAAYSMYDLIDVQTTEES